MRSKNIVRLLSCLLPAAALALTACSEDPTASGTGTPARIELSRSTTFQEVGRQATVSAWVRDAAGNRLSEAVTAVANGSGVTIDSLIFHPETSESRIFITPTAIDTTAFVVVSAGSLSDTVYVSALPASLVITLADSIGSGATLTPTVTARSATGATLGTVKYSVSSSDQSKVVVNANGSITARGTGLVTLTFTGPGGKITATKDIRVVPGPFTGTTATAAGPNGSTELVFSSAAGARFDADTKVSMNTGDQPIVLSQDSSQITVILPFNLAAGDYTYSLTNVGSSQLALTGTINLAATASTDNNEPANDVLPSPVTITPGITVGSMGGGDDYDYYTLVVPTRATYVFDLAWGDGADLDAELPVPPNTEITVSCSQDYMGCAAASTKNPEHGSVTLDPGTYQVLVVNFGPNGGRTTYVLKVTQQ